MIIKNEEVKNFMLDTEDDFTNIYETSLVSNPATGMNFLKFKDDKKIEKLNFKQVDINGYQRMLSGVWFMPNTKYIRTKYDEQGEPIFYTTEITEQGLYNALLKYLKSGNYDNFQIEHSGEYETGFYTMEHWIYKNPETRSPIFGLSIADLGYSEKDIKVGTVLKTVYVSDERFWNEQVLTGVVNGFSIGALFGLKENMQNKSTLFTDSENITQQVEKTVQNFKNSEIVIDTKNEEIIDVQDVVENVQEVEKVVDVEKVADVEKVVENSNISKTIIDTLELFKMELFSMKNEMKNLVADNTKKDAALLEISKAKEQIEKDLQEKDKTIENQSILLSQNEIPTKNNIKNVTEPQKFKTKTINVGGKEIECFDLGSK
jgi:hypothetical protein